MNHFGDNISLDLFLDPFPILYSLCPPQQNQKLGDFTPSSSSSSSDIEDFHDSQNKEDSVYEYCQPPTKKVKMEKFPEDQLTDFKHVIYNCLVDNFNDPQNNKLVIPCTLEEGDSVKHGFRFNQNMDISSEIPQLYGKYIRKGNLKNDVILSPIFRKDLEKFYLRSTLELLGKYFTKRGKYCYLYNSIPLFVPGSSLGEAEQRLKKMKTKQRKRKNDEM